MIQHPDPSDPLHIYGYDSVNSWT